MHSVVNTQTITLAMENADQPVEAVQVRLPEPFTFPGGIATPRGELRPGFAVFHSADGLAVGLRAVAFWKTAVSPASWVVEGEVPAFTMALQMGPSQPDQPGSPAGVQLWDASVVWGRVWGAGETVATPALASAQVEWGDGDSVELVAPFEDLVMHTYPGLGDYTVTLTARFADNPDRAPQVVYSEDPMVSLPITVSE